MHNFGDLFLTPARLSASQTMASRCSPWVSRSKDVHLIVFGGDLKSARSCNHLSSASLPDPQSATMLWTKRVVLRRPGHHLEGARRTAKVGSLSRVTPHRGPRETSYPMYTHGSRNPLIHVLLRQRIALKHDVPRTQVADVRITKEWRLACACSLRRRRSFSRSMNFDTSKCIALVLGDADSQLEVATRRIRSPPRHE